MARYFLNFPKVYHSFDNKFGVLVTDLTKRVGLNQRLGNNTAMVYYKYQIQEGDTPEIIAEKYYGDAEKHWLVLMANNIIDPYKDWPKTYNEFLIYINEKYGSTAAAKSQIHHYEKIITTTDNYSGTVDRRTYIIDQTSYNQIVPTTTTRKFPNGTSVTVEVNKRQVDSYQYEEELNESKRNIRLINSEFANQAYSELKMLLSK